MLKDCVRTLWLWSKKASIYVMFPLLWQSYFQLEGWTTSVGFFWPPSLHTRSFEHLLIWLTPDMNADRGEWTGRGSRKSCPGSKRIKVWVLFCYITVWIIENVTSASPPIVLMPKCGENLWLWLKLYSGSQLFSFSSIFLSFALSAFSLECWLSGCCVCSMY